MVPWGREQALGKGEAQGSPGYPGIAQ